MEGTWAPRSPDLSSYYQPDQDVNQHPQHQGYRGSVSHIPPTFTHTPPGSSPTLHNKALPPPAAYQPPPQHAYMPRGMLKEESMQDADYVPDAPMALPNMHDTGNGTSGSTLPPGAENIVIKNHFPVARIKRIMQADDDVGKVAQVTPVVVSKALELFMISLVTKAATEAKARNSKRVGALHLKAAITKNEQFDFLNDIVSKVADAPEKSEDGAETEGKKKKAGTRKKKKADDDDDF